MQDNMWCETLVAYVATNRRELNRFAYSYVKDRDEANDIVQEAVMKALRGMDTLREPIFIKTWFYRIIANESVSFLRKQKRLYITNDLTASLPCEDGDTAERMDLYSAVNSLDEKLKTIVVLRFFEDMKIEDIARQTGTNINTVKSRLYKAIKILRRAMQ